jgi:[histone H3]-lysine4 N-trimethyltransferase SETD1
VTLDLHDAVAVEASTSDGHWDEDKLIDKASQMIEKQLAIMLEKDIMERVVAPRVRKIVGESKTVKTTSIFEARQPEERRGLEGLSFKKKVKVPKMLPSSLPSKPQFLDQPHRLVEHVTEAVPEVDVEEEPEVEEEPKVEAEPEVEEEIIDKRPTKRRKKESKKKKTKVVIESEEEDNTATAIVLPPLRPKKRPTPDHDEQSDIEPPSKKTKVAKHVELSTPDEQLDDVVMVDDLSYSAPNLVLLPPTPDSTLSRSVTPAVDTKVISASKKITPPSTLCEDEEDMYLAKMLLSGTLSPDTKVETPSSADAITAGVARIHLTGSARTEGYYKISHIEKATYVSQYQVKGGSERETKGDKKGDKKGRREEPPPPQAPQATSSRSNRANARRRAQGLEEINQVQRAVALSKGESANELSFKFNQLQTRKKHLRFARSPIHDWGLYAMERISKGEMVIEYVGEVIRAQVAEKREKAYERVGIGSSYLFRIDEDLVVDATMKGNLGYVFSMVMLYYHYFLFTHRNVLSLADSSITVVTPIAMPKSSLSAERKRLLFMLSTTSSSETRSPMVFKSLLFSMNVLCLRRLFRLPLPY